MCYIEATQGDKKMKYFMVFFPFDATSLDVDAPAEMQSCVSKLPDVVKRLVQPRSVKEWRAVSHSVTVQGKKGLLSILVEIPTT